MSTSLKPGKTREKQKWQIALRRYVVEKHPNPFYAPYFGLDVAHFRSWIEGQFSNDLSWDNFGTSWQFEFTIPLTFFNFQEESDLKLAWNYLNIRVGRPSSKDDTPRSDLLFAKNYFTALSRHTSLSICQQFLAKIESLEAEQTPPAAQLSFLDDNALFLDQISGFGSIEFELLNNGRPLQAIPAEAAILKKLQ